MCNNILERPTFAAFYHAHGEPSACFELLVDQKMQQSFDELQNASDGKKNRLRDSVFALHCHAELMNLHSLHSSI